jgi:hypothetical protein
MQDVVSETNKTMILLWVAGNIPLEYSARTLVELSKLLLAGFQPMHG